MMAHPGIVQQVAPAQPGPFPAPYPAPAFVPPQAPVAAPAVPMPPVPPVEQPGFGFTPPAAPSFDMSGGAPPMSGGPGFDVGVPQGFAPPVGPPQMGFSPPGVPDGMQVAMPGGFPGGMPGAMPGAMPGGFAAPAGKSKRTMFIIIGAVVVVVGGFLLYWFVFRGGSCDDVCDRMAECEQAEMAKEIAECKKGAAALPAEARAEAEKACAAEAAEGNAHAAKSRAKCVEKCGKSPDDVKEKAAACADKGSCEEFETCLRSARSSARPGGGGGGGGGGTCNEVGEKLCATMGLTGAECEAAKAGTRMMSEEDCKLQLQQLQEAEKALKGLGGP